MKRDGASRPVRNRPACRPASTQGKERKPTPLTPEDLQVIHDEVERLERKIQALLDYARPTRPPTLLPLELSGLIQQALHLVQTRLSQQKVSVQLAGCDQPITVAVDRDQFLSVLVNLFLNALDAMPHGGELLLTAQPSAGHIRLDVADTGPGIAPEVIGRLFTPFASTRPTGTGLGLSVCRRIIEEHGGQLTASNRPEGGACLTICLPQDISLEHSDHANHPARG